MKNLASLMFVALFVLMPVDLRSAAAQGTLERSILGAVIEQQEQEKTKDRTVVVEIKLDTTIDGVEVALSEELVKAATVVPLDGSKTVKGKDGINWTSDLPTTTVRLRIDFPQSIADKLDKALSDGLKLKFKLGDGVIGTQTFKVKNAAPTSVFVELDKVGMFPPKFHPGINSFSPYEGYTNEDGTWEIKLKTDKGPLDLPVSPVVNNEAFMRGVGYTPPKRDITLDQSYFDTPKKPKEPGPLGFIVPPDLPADAFLELKFVDQFGRLRVGAVVTADKFIDLGQPPFLITCTPKIFMGDKLCVCGFFPTQFTRGQLMLDGKPLGALAGSLDTIVFQPKGLRPGRHIIDWNVEAFKWEGNPELGTRQPPSTLEQVEFVLLEVQGAIDRNALFTGEGTALRLKIIGSEEKLDIQLDNLTPEIVEVEGGTSQIVTSSGGANNTVEKKVRGTKRGNFNIKYRLALPPCPCNPQITSEVMELVGKTDPDPESRLPDPQVPLQPGTLPENCGSIFARCAQAETDVYQLESEFEKAINGCRKGRGANDPAFYASCIDRTRARYGLKLKEAYQKELECYQRYQACVKREEEEAKTRPANPAPEKTPEDCNAIDAECKRLESRADAIGKMREVQIQKCKRIHKSDVQALINCQKLVGNYYESLLDAAEKKLEECRKRLAACRAKQGGQ